MYVAIPNLIAIVVSPLMGAFIDHFGMNLFLVLRTCVCLTNIKSDNNSNCSGRTIICIIVATALLALTHLMCLGRALGWNHVGDIHLAIIMTVAGILIS
jgi:hypothetical protein